ncbi:MAG: hypothetical protein V4694_06740 [Pseudomonadota bacterium]
MTEEIKDFKLTGYKYPPRNSKTLSEIQSYLKAYDRGQLRLWNPFSGQSVNVVELLNPMVRPRFTITGAILMISAFISNMYTLNNLTADSALISYITFMCANLGAALLLPTFIVVVLNRVNHARGKKAALRGTGYEMLQKELPDLKQISDELILQLSQDYSPMLNGAAELFGGLKKNITTEQVIAIFNYIFADDNFDPTSLIEDMERFENGRNEFTKMLQKGLDYGSDLGVIQDPKFVQFLSFAFAIGFLKREDERENKEYRFPNLHIFELLKVYQDFCAKFLAYCKTEYGAPLTEKHVIGRIMKLMDGFIAHGKITIEVNHLIHR